MKFNKNIAGKKYVAIQDEVYSYTMVEGGLFSGWSGSTSFGSATVSVVLNGWQVTSAKGNVMSQTIDGKWISIPEGWRESGMGVAYTSSEAQNVINKTIANNQRIFANNLFCARFAHHLSSSEKKMLYELQSRLEERDNQLSDPNLVQQARTSSPAGYSKLADWLTGFMATGGIGAVISTTVIVVSAIVMAGAATAAYLLYRKIYKESVQDVEYSKKLTKTLTSKLTAQEYQQLLNETGGIVTKAKIKSQFKTSSRWLSAIGVLAAAGLAYYVWRDKK